MNDGSIIDSFQKEIESVVDKYRDEGISCAEAIGVLEVVKMDIYQETRSDLEGEGF